MTKKAVGIGYEKGVDAAPKVVAKGTGYLAEKIIEKAKELGIHVKEDKNLVEILSALDLSQEIPEELYGVMAEVFTFVYNLDKKKE